MKRTVLFLAVLLTASVSLFAQQTVTIKSGTVIPLKATTNVRAAHVHEGETVNFALSSDFVVEGIKILDRGTIVKGTVQEARKSTVAGTKGRLVINISNLTLPNGEPLYLTDTTVRVYGKNKTALAVCLGVLIWPLVFIPGTRAEMPEGYEVMGHVAANTIYTIQ